MAANKTQETDADVAAFVAGVADPAQRADAHTLIALMAKATGEPARMWGSAIIGFGRYHYRYDSGREGDAPRVAFSPRKGKTTLYLAPYFVEQPGVLDDLGKHAIGKGCLYVKRLGDIDLAVLERVVAASLQEVARRHPE